MAKNAFSYAADDPYILILPNSDKNSGHVPRLYADRPSEWSVSTLQLHC